MSRGDPNRNLVAALSYLLGFVTGIVILLVEKDDRYIRFHAMQSTLIFATLFVLNIVLDIVLKPVDFLGFLSTAINSLITLVAVALWVISMYKAYQGQIFKWPIVGQIAEAKVK